MHTAERAEDQAEVVSDVDHDGSRPADVRGIHSPSAVARDTPQSVRDRGAASFAGRRLSVRLQRNRHYFELTPRS
jgi:hypothetical protein